MAGKETGSSARSGIASRRAVARDGDNPVYRERRAEVLKAAATVFKAKGLAGTNLGDIAAEAGADRASLYYYVGSKEELFHEVVREAVGANLAWARELRASDAPAPAKLRRMLSELMRSYADNYPILYVFLQENLTRMPEKYAQWSKEMRSSNKEFEEIVVEIIGEGMAAGTVRAVGPPVLVAYGLLGMVGWTYRWYNPETSVADAQQVAAVFADTLLLGLQA